MNLEAMSKEQLIKELKKHMMKCIKTSIIELGTGKTVTFNKGECYYIDQNEGGIYIVSDCGEYFDVYDEDYSKILNNNFVEIRDEEEVKKEQEEKAKIHAELIKMGKKIKKSTPWIWRNSNGIKNKSTKESFR